MWNDTEIVTIDQAQHQIKDHTHFDEEHQVLLLKLAHGIILDYVYLSRTADEDLLAEMQAWDEETAPAGVRAAIIRMFAHLNRFRGDDVDVKFDANDLPPDVRQLLRMHKDPVVA